ncbi:sortase [Streptomyces sp. NPDC002577]
MRYSHVGAGIGLVLGALGLHVPVAAADGSDIYINPWSASPGSTVTVTTTACGPDVTFGKGWSKVGGQFNLFGDDGEGALTGHFRIPKGTRPGTDTITLKCPPRIKITETYQVTGRSPRGSVGAGFGPAEGSSDLRLALGGALIAGAAAVGAVRMRRRVNIGRA